MPITYTGFYDVVDLGGGQFQITSTYDPSSTTFSDTADGTPDETIAIGGRITATSGNTFTETLIGTVPGEGPITDTGFGSILFSTNDSTLSIGDTVIADQTSPFVVCFLEGTLIATPTGEVPVETLRRGDEILTASGQTVTVKWLGRQTIRKSIFTSSNSAPVCISAGALGSGLPHCDLYVTTEHGLVLDGFVINAGALVNGGTIRMVPLAEMPETFSYFHVETENHDVILANGAAAETMIDYAGRQVFDNYAEYADLYSDEPVTAEMPAPRIASARLLPAALKARLGIQRAA